MKSETKIKICVLIGVTIVILFLIWRASFDKVRNILRFLPEYEGKRIYILGRTQSALSIPFVGSIYKINDGSGGIWVISEVDSTVNNRIIFISGVLEKEFDLEKTEFIQPFKKDIPSFKPPGPIIIEKSRDSLFSSLKLIAGKRG